MRYAAGVPHVVRRSDASAPRRSPEPADRRVANARGIDGRHGRGRRGAGSRRRRRAGHRRCGFGGTDEGDDDGHLLVFRSMHNTELRVARSPMPHSIEGTWTDTLIPEGLGATYPMPFKTASGAIFVFIRETAGDFDKQYPTDFRPMKYVRSTD